MNEIRQILEQLNQPLSRVSRKTHGFLPLWGAEADLLCREPYQKYDSGRTQPDLASLVIERRERQSDELRSLRR